MEPNTTYDEVEREARADYRNNGIGFADEVPDLYEDDSDLGYDDDDGLTDVEADAMTLASAGWGVDEDYNYGYDNDPF